MKKNAFPEPPLPEKESDYSKNANISPKKTFLAIASPKLAAEWHPTKNGTLTPQQVSAGSGKKVWWLCPEGHEYEAIILNRSLKNTGCPFCAGRQLIPGETDLATTNPKLAAQWHPTLNGDLTPQQVSTGSNKKVWWLCPEGHEYEATIVNRSLNHTGCPFCSGRRPIPGKNDLATVNPDLASQWHPTKNGTLTPHQVPARSHKKAWWLCPEGHEYEAAIANRSANSTGCPFCSGKQPIPGKTDLATTNPKLAAEWHPTKNGDLTPQQVSAGSQKRVWWLCPKGHKHEATIANRSLNHNGCPFCSGKRLIPGETDLATTNPKLAAEWHPTLNGDLTPYQVSAGSGKKVWWLCPEGHEYEATIEKRSSRNTGCPFCSGRRPIPGENDSATVITPEQTFLAIASPKLAAEWHPTKNGDLTPTTIKFRSSKKVWWLCPEGHEYEATIANRSAKSTGCPFCSGRRPIPGETDLATTNPKLAAEWHPTKNGDLTPANVKRGYSKKVWWLCPEGHEYEAKVSSRTTMLSGCPFCARKQPIPGKTDLATTNPKLAAEWHPTLNDDLTPQQVSAGFHKKVWWLCPKGHEYEAIIKSRSLNNNGCPFCSGKRLIPGETDLATTNPKLAAQWHPTLNDDLTPQQVSAGCRKKVWWFCPEGHEYEATIVNRALRNSGCPFCSGRRPILGKTDLATINSALASEWHPTLNGDLTPQQVSAGSGKKVWWLCPEGHEYEAAIAKRSLNHNGCPLCTGKRPIQRKTNLATTNPKLAAQWHPTLNGDLTPYQVSAGSSKKVWWKCPEGHEYEATILNRSSKNSGCPFCSGRRPIPGETDLATTNPKLAAEWHPTKNGDLTPSNVKPGYIKKVWWLGKCGHEWEAVIKQRNNGSKCPLCTKKQK